MTGCSLPLVCRLRYLNGVEEASLVELQEGLSTARWSSLTLVQEYLARIDQLDKNGPRINALIELNPAARSIALALDRDRKEKDVRGRRHGIPVLMKDNIETGDRLSDGPRS